MQVPVDWAGMPVFGANRELVGFRGFGLLRMDALRERTSPEQPSNDSEPSDDPGHPTADLIAQSLVNDDTLPFRPPEEMQQTQDAESEPPEEDTWFSDLRNQVAEALSNTVPSEPEPVEPAPAAKQPTSSLSNAERSAFREIARALGARLAEDTPSAHQPNRIPPAADRAEAGREAETAPSLRAGQR